MDYKNYEEGKYPEPADRRVKKDYPEKEQLFVYGEDFPMPESMDDLRCTYNEDDRFPLELEELRGFKVPPLGMSYVSTIGGGGRLGMSFRPGTFRKNRGTIGKEFGKTTTELTLIQADKKEQAMLSALAKGMDKHGIKITGSSSADTLEAFWTVVVERLLDPDTPIRELRLAGLTDIPKILSAKKESADKARENVAAEFGKMSMKVLVKMLGGVDGLIADKKGEIVDIELHDVGDPDSEADI